MSEMNLSGKSVGEARAEKQHSLIFWGVLAVAVVLRLLWVGRESLWLDESYSWWISTGSWDRAATGEPTNPPLYYLMLHLWTKVFGTSEAGLRSLSVAGSVGSVYLVYLLGRELFSWRIAVTAAAYQAVSSFQIYYAQEARCFAWLVFWLLLASYCQLRAWRPDTKSAAGWMALFFAAAVLSLYTHFIAIFFLAVQGLLSLIWWLRGKIGKGRFWMHAGASVAALLVYLPWLEQMLKASSGGGQKRRYLLLKLPQTYFSFLFGDTLIPLDEAAVRNIMGTLQENIWLLVLLAGLSVLMIPYLYRSAKRWGEGWQFGFALAVLPVLIVFLVSFRIMILDERYVQTSAPFAYLVVAAAMLEAWDGGKGWKRWVLCGGYGGMLALSLEQYFYATDRYGKEEWRELTQRIESQANAGQDLLLFEEGYVHYPYDYYQTKKLRYWKLNGENKVKLLARDPKTIAEIQAARRVWFVRAYTTTDQILNILEEALGRKQPVEFKKGHGLELFEFEPKEKAER